MSIKNKLVVAIFLCCIFGCRGGRRNVVELETSNRFLGYAAKNLVDSAKTMLLTDLSVIAKDHDSFSGDIQRLSFLINSFKLPLSSETKGDIITSGNGDVFIIFKYSINLNNNRRVADSIGAKRILIEVKILKSRPLKILDYNIDGEFEQSVLPPCMNCMRNR